MKWDTLSVVFLLFLKSASFDSNIAARVPCTTVCKGYLFPSLYFRFVCVLVFQVRHWTQYVVSCLCSHLWRYLCVCRREPQGRASLTFVYGWLCWVFATAPGRCSGCGHGLLSAAASLVAEPGPWVSWAQELWCVGSGAGGMQNSPEPQIEPVSSVLAGRFPTPEPPGKSRRRALGMQVDILFLPPVADYFVVHSVWNVILLHTLRSRRYFLCMLPFEKST